MKTITVSQLLLYPVKSLGAVSVSEAVVEERGFRYDRRFMVVETASASEGQVSSTMMTQRTHTDMALIEVAFAGETLQLWHRRDPADVLTVPLTPLPTDDTVLVSVWDSGDFMAQAVGDEADAWLSRVLKTTCRLVYMPDITKRAITSGYRRPDDYSRMPVVSFADGFPYLLVSRESLAELNQRLSEPVGMNRFRPNLVVEGATGPHDEDSWAHFTVGTIPFFGVKPCVRCVMTTIDPKSGQKGKEPLKTLATYRQTGHKILFGQNVLVLPETGGVVRVGDPVEVLKRMETWL